MNLFNFIRICSLMGCWKYKTPSRGWVC